jgi:hypothetical protein
MTDDVRPLGIVGRGLPTATSDNIQVPQRLGRHGELVTMPVAGSKLWGLADEGSYFFASNPTPGTGIAGIAAADGFNAAETLFLLYNTATASEGTRLYLDFLELHCTVVDTNGTDIRYDMHIDNGDRYTSGGSAITPVNVNMDSSAAAKGRLKFGALVSAAASSAVRYVGGRLLASTDLVANDMLRFDFGSPTSNQGQAVNVSEEATLGRIFQVSCPPIVLGPGHSFLFSVNCASQSGAATWSFNSGWSER